MFATFTYDAKDNTKTADFYEFKLKYNAMLELKDHSCNFTSGSQYWHNETFIHGAAAANLQSTPTKQCVITTFNKNFETNYMTLYETDKAWRMLRNTRPGHLKIELPSWGGYDP